MTASVWSEKDQRPREDRRTSGSIKSAQAHSNLERQVTAIALVQGDGQAEPRSLRGPLCSSSREGLTATPRLYVSFGRRGHVTAADQWPEGSPGFRLTLTARERLQHQRKKNIPPFPLHHPAWNGGGDTAGGSRSTIWSRLIVHAALLIDPDFSRGINVWLPSPGTPRPHISVMNPRLSISLASPLQTCVFFPPLLSPSGDKALHTWTLKYTALKMIYIYIMLN